MTRFHGFVMAAFFAGMTAGMAQAQSAANAPAAAANAIGVSGQPGRGITAVTRRTLMVAPGQQANAFFAAGGVNVAAPAAAGVSAAGATVAAPAPVSGLVQNSPGLQRPDVQTALRQLAAGGNAEARQLLKKPASGAAATATGASR